MRNRVASSTFEEKNATVPTSAATSSNPHPLTILSIGSFLLLLFLGGVVREVRGVLYGFGAVGSLPDTFRSHY